MIELVEKIKKEAVIRPGGVVIVNGFLNHRMDTKLIDNIGKEFFRLFGETKPTVILTVEASGIGIACLAARYFGVDVVFAKKSASKNVPDEVYSSEVKSFTKGTVFDVRVDKKFITSSDRVLIIDDFLAVGEALSGMINIVKQSGAEIVGAGICVEKSFQPGGKKIREMGINLHSLAVVDLNPDGTIDVREEK